MMGKFDCVNLEPRFSPCLKQPADRGDDDVGYGIPEEQAALSSKFGQDGDCAPIGGRAVLLEVLVSELVDAQAVLVTQQCGRSDALLVHRAGQLLEVLLAMQC